LSPDVSRPINELGLIVSVRSSSGNQENPGPKRAAAFLCPDAKKRLPKGGFVRGKGQKAQKSLVEI